ncbi:related to high affinity methionine permease [Phialocephala subalpina]|uniref:Related to high affinity methionine permease n=1 Tax=Phialocephala subalpina TaxID=576137 RepID=A0A1L7XAS7_9HELO|nr:related to high affinity methionine permease [Phialocephala subalpina]
MSFWRKPFSKRPGADTVEEVSHDAASEISDGSIKYVGNQGGNNAPPTFQEASGAPVESESPMGYSVNAFTILFLNINMMIGTGIFSTPSAILSGTGSIGLSFIYWTLGYLLCIAMGSVYLEYTAYFPSRSGSEVVFLEQAYPRPTWFFPTTFAVQNVVFSFSSSNAIVLANYLFKTAGTTGTAWQVKGVALAGYTVATLVLIFHTKFSYHLSNGIGIIKVTLLLFIIITGFVILGGGTKVEDPKANFRDSFAGTGTASAYGLTNALYRIIFSYGGYNNAFNVANEIKNPVRSLKKNATLALTIVYVLYMFTNVSWFAGVKKYDLEHSKLTTASLWFENVLGGGRVRGLNFLIALSAFGNMVSGSLGSSRMIRECGRQGVLPWTNFWASTKPFGTPLGPYAFKWGITALMILAIPTGDAFNFVADLGILPGAAFNLAMAVGIYLVRWRRKRANLPRPEFRAWDVLVIFNIAVQLYLLVMPWYPPANGGADVSFWYGTYCVTGVGILIVCGIYYYVWAKWIPKWKGYQLRQEVVNLGGGAEAHLIAKVPVNEVEAWDANHDAAGRIRNMTVTELSDEKAARTSSEADSKDASAVRTLDV